METNDYSGDIALLRDEIGRIYKESSELTALADREFGWCRDYWTSGHAGDREEYAAHERAATEARIRAVRMMNACSHLDAAMHLVEAAMEQ